MISDLNKAMRKLREAGPYCVHSGICYNATVILAREYGAVWQQQRVTREIEKLAANWPEYSGNKQYPVPAYGNGSERGGGNSIAAYDTCSSMFSTEHEYGRARLRLLNYLIEVTDEQ